jgi:hypothetical protein
MHHVKYFEVRTLHLTLWFYLGHLRLFISPSYLVAISSQLTSVLWEHGEVSVLGILSWNFAPILVPLKIDARGLGGVAQVLELSSRTVLQLWGPEFSLQYHQKKKKKTQRHSKAKEKETWLTLAVLWVCVCVCVVIFLFRKYWRGELGHLAHDLDWGTSSLPVSLMTLCSRHMRAKVSK